LALATDLVDNDELALSRHHDPVVLLLDQLHRVEADRALVARFDRRLLGADLTDATDVERTHRELRARLADRLRRDNTDRFADVHHVTASEVAAVAQRANTAAGPARQ